MQNIFIDILPPWVETGLQPAFYDLESGTVLQQTARMYAKVRELTEGFNTFTTNVANEINRFETETNNEIERFENATDAEIKRFENATDAEIERFENATDAEIERFEGVINDTVENYIQKFNDLHDYVEDYFDNLDVQAEINNKLDAMVEDGTLQEIITTYIQSNVAWTFDTVADMKNATNLVNGSFAQTLGYYSADDGGGAIYKITNSGTADEMEIIAVGDLKAHLQIIDGKVNVKQLGAKGDGTTNDHDIIAKAFTLADTVTFTKATYKIDTPIVLSNINDINIEGNNATLLGDGFASENVGNHGWFEFDTCNNIKIDSLNIDGNITWAARPYSWESGYSEYSTNREHTYDAYKFWQCSNVSVKNCLATKIKVGFHLSYTINGEVDHCQSIKTMADGVYIHDGCKGVHVSNHYVEDGNDDQFSMAHETPDTTDYVDSCSYTNCTAKNCFGACATMLECINCSTTNCSSINNRDVPVKMGTALGTFAGKNNVMDNITVESSNTIYGTSSSLTVAETNGTMQMYGGIASTVTTMTGCEIINSRFIETSGNNLSLIITKQNGYTFKNCEFTGINIIGVGLTGVTFEDCTINSKDGNVFNGCSGVVFRNCDITYDQTYQARGKRALQYINCNNVITDNCRMSGSTHSDNRAMGYYADSTDYTGALTNINVPFSVTNQSGIYSPCIITLDNFSDYYYPRFKAGQLLYFTGNNKLYLTTGTGWINLNQ